MLVSGALYGNVAHIVGFAIFGSSLILLYSTSTLYHFFPKEHRVKNILQRIDHSMIFILIAGTYTPILLLIPQRGWGWSIFGVIWGLTIIGFILKIIGIKMKNWVSLLIYIAMGWLIVVAINPLMQWITPQALWWLVAGGVLYTFGCIFFSLDKIVRRTHWFGMHEVFHIFVIAGSFSHFWFMFRYLVYF